MFETEQQNGHPRGNLEMQQSNACEITRCEIERIVYGHFTILILPSYNDFLWDETGGIFFATGTAPCRSERS
jgi:hypothetical protein